MFQTLERFRKEMQVVIYHAHFYNAIVVIQIHTLCGDLLVRADMECPRHRTEKGRKTHSADVMLAIHTRLR